jgi:hypothetical protein
MSDEGRNQAAVVLLVVCTILVVPLAVELIRRGEKISVLIALAALQFSIVAIIARLKS